MNLILNASPITIPETPAPSDLPLRNILATLRAGHQARDTEADRAAVLEIDAFQDAIGVGG